VPASWIFFPLTWWKTYGPKPPAADISAHLVENVRFGLPLVDRLLQRGRRNECAREFPSPHTGCNVCIASGTNVYVSSYRGGGLQEGDVALNG
jgi:hypothetical protein